MAHSTVLSRIKLQLLLILAGAKFGNYYLLLLGVSPSCYIANHGKFKISLKDTFAAGTMLREFEILMNMPEIRICVLTCLAHETSSY